uniref:TraR/DksA family transcriptional regulator n=1 Tax=Streptomyces sp. NBC_00093 TaxID=2975649 RepID=A0AAU2A7N0_9ACTN
MVAKKTAVQQSASSRSTGSAAEASGNGKGADVKKRVGGGPAEGSAVGAAGAKRARVKEAVPKGDAPKKIAVRKSAAKKTAGARAAPEAAVAQAAADETAAKGMPVKETAAKRAAVGETVAKEAAATETVGTKTVATKAVAKKAPAKKGVAKKAVRKKTAASGSAAGTRTSTKSTANKAGAAEAAKTTGATTVVAKKTPGTATAAKKPSAVPKARLAAAAEPGELAVRPGEDPWTPEEVAEARTELQSEVLRLRAEITRSEQSLVGLMRDSGDGAGDDQADTGTKNITREGEMALAANAREMLVQDERALERLDAGTYGLCENCGNPIGKARMQAFPRATLCVECKQKQERRY